MSQNVDMDEFRRKRAAKIKKAFLNKGWIQDDLARKSGHDVRTIRKVLAGNEPIQDRIIVDVCQALGIEAELSDAGEPEIEVAESWYGSYAREPYKDYEGAYFAYRRSFTFPNVFVRSVYEITWHPEDWIFMFREHQSYTANNKRRVDHSQTGEVYISQYTDLIHLVTVVKGAVRTVTLRKMRDSMMRGCMLTQSDRETFFQPCVSAIFLEKIFGLDVSNLDDAKIVGPIEVGHDDYVRVAEELATVERSVMFVAKAETNLQTGP